MFLVETREGVELYHEHALAVLVVLNVSRYRVKCKLSRLSSRVIGSELAGAWAVNPKVSATSR